MQENFGLIRVFKKYIQHTPKNAIVPNIKIFFCLLTKTVIRVMNLKTQRVYITSRMLKHLYDKRTAEEFDFFLYNTKEIISYPDHIYKNKESKRGQFLLVKKLKENLYVCSLEIINFCTPEEENQLATYFRIRPDYLKNYTRLWSWENGGPPS